MHQFTKCMPCPIFFQAKIISCEAYSAVLRSSCDGTLNTLYWSCYIWSVVTHGVPTLHVTLYMITIFNRVLSTLKERWPFYTKWVLSSKFTRMLIRQRPDDQRLNTIPWAAYAIQILCITSLQTSTKASYTYLCGVNLSSFQQNCILLCMCSWWSLGTFWWPLWMQ